MGTEDGIVIREKGRRDRENQDALFHINGLISYCEGSRIFQNKIPMLKEFENEITWIYLTKTGK